MAKSWEMVRVLELLVGRGNERMRKINEFVLARTFIEWMERRRGMSG